MRRSGEGRSGATLFRQRPQTRHLPPKAPTPRYRPTSPKLRVQGVPCCHLPLPPNPLHPLPYPHAHPHAPGRNRSSRAGRGTSTPPASNSRCSPTPHAEGAEPAPAKAGGSPCQGTGAGLALPCFPLSISGHLSPRPSVSVRLAPCQIRLVPLCRRFRRPPAGPSDHHPASAWQIRLVSLCRLVRRASIPSCAASPQAGPAGKNARHNSKQVNPPERGGVRATGVSGHAAVASLRGSPEGETPLARGLGDVPPLPKTSEGGWAQPTSQCRSAKPMNQEAQAEGAGLALPTARWLGPAPPDGSPCRRTGAPPPSPGE